MAITLNKAVTEETECASLSAVREEILKTAKKNAEEGKRDAITVELEHAVYNLDEPFVLSAKENPELASLDITLRAKYTGRSYIQSLVRLDGKRFVRAEDTPYFTYQLDKDESGNYPRFHDLHLNFNRIPMARSPFWRNPDALSAEDRDGTSRRGFYAPIDIVRRLSESDIGATEIVIYIEWQFCALHATGVDLSDTKLVDGETYALITVSPEEMTLFCKDCHVNLNILNREVHLRNCPAYITEKEDTYAYDPKSGVLYINPHDKVHMQYHAVEYPTLENLFFLDGLERFTLEGISFTGTTSKYICDNIYYSGQGNCETRARRLRHAAVVASNMKRFTVKSCSFRGLGGNGLLLVDQTNSAVIEGNLFEDISMCALSVGNPANNWVGDPKNRNFNVRVENNLFRHIAYDYPSALCIYIGMVDTLKILHNTIEGCGYSAMSVGWRWSRAGFTPGEDCNIRDAEIAYNYIHNYMDVLRDGGAVYVVGGNADPDYITERFNRMHDNYACLDVSRDGSKYGYYCDGSASNWDVRDSVIVNCLTPVFSQHTVASAFAYHNHHHDIYSTTPVTPGSHAPARDCLIYDYHMVKEGEEALFEAYPEAKKIKEAAGCKVPF